MTPWPMDPKDFSEHRGRSKKYRGVYWGSKRKNIGLWSNKVYSTFFHVLSGLKSFIA